MNDVNALIGAKDVPVKDLDDHLCSCGSKYFRNVTVFKKLPALISPTGKPELLQLPIGAVCDKCGNRFERPTDAPVSEPSKIIT